MVQIRMLSDEWLSRYELLKNLNIKLIYSVTGTGTWEREGERVTAISPCASRLENGQFVRRRYTIQYQFDLSRCII